MLSLLLPHIERFAGGDPAAAEAAEAAATATTTEPATTTAGPPWPAEWLEQIDELPGLFAYTSQMAVFAAAAVAAVPSPLLPQEVADLWQQQRQQLVQERPDETSAAAVATPKKSASHTVCTAELQRRIGNVLKQPSLQVLQQCSRIALALCSWGHFECLSLQLLFQVAAAAVHALRPLAPIWLQQQEQALQQAAASEDIHPPLLVLQQQQLSRARAAIEEATGDLGFTIALLQCLCPQILRGLMHAGDLQLLLNDCDALLDAAAAARRHTPPSRPAAAAAAQPTTTSSSSEKSEAAETDAYSLGIDAATAVTATSDAHEDYGATAAETAEAPGVGEELSDAATAKPRANGGGDWHLLETEVASILRGLIPSAEGPPVKAAHMRHCGVACTHTQQQDLEQSPVKQLLHPLQLQRQGKPLLLAFIFPADTWGRRQGILLPKKLLQFFLLRRLGWEVRLVNLSDCRNKGALEIQQLLVSELNAGQTQTALWSLHKPQQGDGASPAEELSEA
ncbi:uncharacterized protein EMH_0022810 [Eimeria mitis]|uniref:RAP domain-containing protein n=1 Tax=Eimeria mitis TaxID=44415 RepID=U6KHI0_9EIME|nr:uncharacterized protein EMH_0022810 [Eimeria mitis]CDJ34913.1 hypothetical protein EMH_0022810 [Eimeria mitis]